MGSRSIGSTLTSRSSNTCWKLDSRKGRKAVLEQREAHSEGSTVSVVMTRHTERVSLPNVKGELSQSLAGVLFLVDENVLYAEPRDGYKLG